jgi:hypothetical protein
MLNNKMHLFMLMLNHLISAAPLLKNAAPLSKVCSSTILNHYVNAEPPQATGTVHDSQAAVLELRSKFVLFVFCRQLAQCLAGQPASIAEQ